MEAKRRSQPYTILILMSLLHAKASLVAVYSVQRHGARNVLPKGIFLTEDALVGGPTLLPQGQLQTYKAGVAFRNRYINNATCSASGTCLPGVGNGTKYGVLNQAGVGFGNFDMFVRSSALDRAVLSGMCFFNGIFPPDPTAPTSMSYMPSGAQVVPIYTQSDSEDLLIRAYTKCDAYSARLRAWYGSPEFAAKARDTEGLREQVQLRMPGTDTSLSNWWNVYDAINVYQTYGVGNPVPYFDDVTFKKIQDLAYWLETAKMRSNLTTNLLGGVALADLAIYLRLAATADSEGSQAYYRLLSLSGHYNTQLGLLAALKLDAWPPAANFIWLTSLPKLAAVMVFELHAVSVAAAAAGMPISSYYVRLVYQDGPAASYDTVPLPCTSAAAAAAVSPSACALSDFLSYASEKAINSSYDWCRACNNFAPAACAAMQLAELRAAATAAVATGAGESGAEGGSGTKEPWKIAVSVVVTFVGTVALAALVAGLWYRRQLAGLGSAAAAAATEPGGLSATRVQAELMGFGGAAANAI